MTASHGSSLELRNFKARLQDFVEFWLESDFFPQLSTLATESCQVMFITAVCGKIRSLCLNQSDQFHAAARKRLCGLTPWESSPGHAQEACGCLLTSKAQGRASHMWGCTYRWRQTELLLPSHPMFWALHDLFTPFVWFLQAPAKHVFCPLRVEGKAHWVMHLLIASAVPSWELTMCHALNKIWSLSSQGRQHERRKQVHKGDNCSLGHMPWRHCRLTCQGKGCLSRDLWDGNRPASGALLCLLPAVLLLLSRRISVRSSGPSLCSPLCDPGQATFLPWASVSSSVNWDRPKQISEGPYGSASRMQ